MGHQVKDIDLLHQEANDLLKKRVLSTQSNSADGIINDLKKVSTILATNWEGDDAKENINSVHDVINGVIGFRNALAGLATSAGDVSVNYRDIQINNLSKKPALSRLHYTDRKKIAPYTKTSAGIRINEGAKEGALKAKEAITNIDSFISGVESDENAMFNENWTDGAGRNEAIAAFKKFKDDYVKTLRPALEKVASNVDKAIQNYKM